MPRVGFGGVEISRLIIGCNPFYGFAHFNNTFAQVMRDLDLNPHEILQSLEEHL